MPDPNGWQTARFFSTVVQTQQSHPTVETICLKHAYSRRSNDFIGFFPLRKVNRDIIFCDNRVADAQENVERAALPPDAGVVPQLQTFATFTNAPSGKLGVEVARY
jgi:hypothetical protein